MPPQLVPQFFIGLEVSERWMGISALKSDEKDFGRERGKGEFQTLKFTTGRPKPQRHLGYPVVKNICFDG